MAKYNISATVSASDKKYILRDITDRIEGGICDDLGFPHDCDGLDKQTAKLVKDTAAKLYDNYIKYVVRCATENVDIVQDAIDYIWDYDPIIAATNKITRRKDVRDRAEEATRDSKMFQLERMADSLGMKVVPEDDDS